MTAAIRTFAFATVVVAVVAAPLFSRLGPPSSPPDRPERGIAGSEGVLPAGWAPRVLRHLEVKRFRLEAAELAAIVTHAEVAAARFGLDPLTVLAVIEVESGFDPFAVSPAGAMGLMQVRADTAREVAARLSIAWEADDALFDPATNVAIGTCYLRMLLDRFGDLDVALAAFHAGPGRFTSDPRLGPISVAYTRRVWKAILGLYETARV
jgi:soluble lytic murein transglycosylase-like protein